VIAGENAIVVLVTAGNAAEAQRIADGLIEGRLAACVSIIPDVFSRYRWGGKVEESHEVLLIVKSRASLLDDIINLVKLRHSYDVPEIVALPVVGGNEDYLEWLRHETH
jgi:periplasmic divalent cation tolerance protein